MVGLKVGPIFYKIGNGSFVHCFFSTVAYNLENNNWGSKFPLLLNKLYNDKLNVDEIDKAYEELKIIKEELKKIEPSKVVWDIEDVSKQPPWGNSIAERITDLSNHFYTSDGGNLFITFNKAMDTAKKVNKELIIKSL